MAFENNITSEAQLKLNGEILNLANLKFNIYDEYEDRIYEDMSVDLFRVYYNLLADNKKEHIFNPMLNYKPEYASYMLYGTSSYDYLILHANEMVSKRQFKSEAFQKGSFLYYDNIIIKKISEEYSAYKKKDTETITSENYLLYMI